MPTKIPTMEKAMEALPRQVASFLFPDFSSLLANIASMNAISPQIHPQHQVTTQDSAMCPVNDLTGC